MKKPKRYDGDEDFIVLAVAVINFRSVTSYTDALQKGIDFFEGLKEDKDIKHSPDRIRSVKLHYDGIEYIAKFEVLKDVLDLGLDENKEYSDTTQALKYIQSSK